MSSLSLFFSPFSLAFSPSALGDAGTTSLAGGSAWGDTNEDVVDGETEDAPDEARNGETSDESVEGIEVVVLRGCSPACCSIHNGIWVFNTGIYN